MKLSPTYRAQFKRRRLGKTDYRQRLFLLESEKPRLVVRKSLNYIRAQIIQFDPKGDKTVLSANSKELKKIGWKFSCNNLPAAYLTGLAIGKAAVKNNVDEVVLDMGLYRSTKGSKIYTVVKGVVDAGLKVSIDKEILPSEDRIGGKHIVSYQEKFKDLAVKFDEIKGKILKSG